MSPGSRPAERLYQPDSKGFFNPECVPVRAGPGDGRNPGHARVGKISPEKRRDPYGFPFPRVLMLPPYPTG